MRRQELNAAFVFLSHTPYMIGEAAVSTCRTVFGRKLGLLDLQLGGFFKGRGRQSGLLQFI